MVTKVKSDILRIYLNSVCFFSLLLEPGEKCNGINLDMSINNTIINTTLQVAPSLSAQWRMNVQNNSEVISSVLRDSNPMVVANAVAACQRSTRAAALDSFS